MSGKSQTKKQKAKRKARRGVSRLSRKKFKGDVLKHYVRVYFWLKRIIDLIRARGDIKTIKYFSLCGEEAFDLRLFRKEGLVNLLQQETTPFVFCENNKDAYEILQRIWTSPCQGFYGPLEEVSTKTASYNYGNFWSTFPFDVINLDFWGDIHKTNGVTENAFYVIQAIIFQQSLLRKPYELWVTWRAKRDRINLNIQHEYKRLISYYRDTNDQFRQVFANEFPNKNDPDDLNIEELVNVGFLAWLAYATERAFSIIEDAEVLVYTRQDKGGKKYKVYNFLSRIKPYETLTIPTPACAAAEECRNYYNRRCATLCFNNLIDIDAKFRSLSTSKKHRLKQQLKELEEEYEEDRSNILL